MSPRPVLMILDNPPDDEFEEEITDDTSYVPQIVASSSESEDELASNNGYQLLPQEPEQEVADEHSATPFGGELTLEENNAASGGHFNTYINQMMNEEMNKTSAADCDNQARSNTYRDEHPMENDRIEKIKALMTNITIPTSAIPEWARIIPEDEWKAQLFSNIEARHAFPTAMNSAQPNGENFNVAFVANFDNT